MLLIRARKVIIHSFWNMCMWEMARRETKANGGTEAVRYFVFCAIIWRHVKLHRSCKSGFFAERRVSYHTGPRWGGPLHGMLFECVWAQVFLTNENSVCVMLCVLMP